MVLAEDIERCREHVLKAGVHLFEAKHTINTPRREEELYAAIDCIGIALMALLDVAVELESRTREGGS